MARMLIAVLAVLAVGVAPANAQTIPRAAVSDAKADPAPKSPGIRFPEVVQDSPVQPEPVPAPKPDPAAATNIPADEIYVIDSDVELFVLSSPAGLVTVSLDPGPLPIRAKFVGGSGKIERKDFVGKFVYSIEAKSSGSGELIVWPKVGATTEKDIARKLIITLTGPQPPPKPLPEPTPAPKPAPPPAPPKPEPGPGPIASADVAWILVIEETASRTPAQGKVLTDAAFWLGLKARGIEWRHYDKDAPGLAAKHYLDYEDQAIDLASPDAPPTAGLPFVLFLDKTGKVIRAFKLPLSSAAIGKQLK